MDLQELLDLLPPSHREQFLSLVSDPDSEQVQRLLGSLENTEREDLEGGSLPWFLIADANDDGNEAEDVNEIDTTSIERKCAKPHPVSEDVLKGINVDPAVGVKLLYNTLAIWYVKFVILFRRECVADIISPISSLAYTQVLLSLALPSLGHVWTTQGTSHHGPCPEILSDEILRLLPFLADAKSTVRYISVREAWEDVWTRSGERDAAETTGIQSSVS